MCKVEPRAKYSYFSRLFRLGLFFAFFSLSLGVPVARAQAFSFSAAISSFFGGSSTKLTPWTDKAESQNSQNISFLEATPNLDPNNAVGGGDINMSDTALYPEISPAGQTIAEIEADENQGKVSLYVVRKDDTLPQIAILFDVTVNTILWANDLEKGATIRSGQILVILPVNGVQHSVKKGDTIESIARKYKGDKTEIREFNDIGAGHILAVGDIIIIPGGIEVSIETPESTSVVAVPKTARSRMIAKYPSHEGYYTHPFPTMVRKSQKIHGFNGVDLAGRIGEAILAAADGVVVISRSGWNGGYGNYIIIEHSNGTQTLYGHMNALYVAPGVRVDKGQSIGEVGNTGRVFPKPSTTCPQCGAHLHFEVRGARNPF